MARNSDMNRILMLFEVERIRTLKRKVYESALAYQSYCDTSGACEKRIEILMDEVITQEEKFTKKFFFEVSRAHFTPTLADGLLQSWLRDGIFFRESRSGFFILG